LQRRSQWRTRPRGKVIRDDEPQGNQDKSLAKQLEKGGEPRLRIGNFGRNKKESLPPFRNDKAPRQRSRFPHAGETTVIKRGSNRKEGGQARPTNWEGRTTHASEQIKLKSHQGRRDASDASGRGGKTSFANTSQPPENRTHPSPRS